MSEARAVAVIAILALVACESPKKREAASVVAAIDRFRAADNREKPALAKELLAVPCADPEICAAKKACTDMAEPTARAIELKSEVEVGLARVEKGELAKDSPEAQGLPQKLDEAERLLNQGRRGLEACDDRVLRLRGAYGI